jgi:hypothetical protein
MTVVRFFADLRTKYPSWNELKTFLTSADGGNLAVLGDGPTVIIRYDKKTSNFNVPYTHAFRSVVWDTVQNIPVSIAPFKAAASAEPQVGEVDLIQDFLEGVMLHVYRTSEGLQLSTRTKLGANTRFYSKRNFSELVTDAPEWSALPLIIPVGTFASLVLQHPEHRIVSPVPTARIYIVDMGMVNPVDGQVEILVNPAQWPEAARALAPPTTSGGLAAGKSATQLVQDEAMKRGSFWQGLVFKNSNTLVRWRIRNPIYTPVRDLRGSEADSYARFLRLRKAGLLQTYIAYYPEETQEFYELEGKFREQTRELFKNYNVVHRGKKEERKDLKNIAWPYKIHVFKLHGLYLADKTQPITLDSVIVYMNALDVIKQRAFLVAPVGGKQSLSQQENTPMIEE